MRNVLRLFALAAAISCNGDITGLGPPSNPATETFAPSLGVDISAMTKTVTGVWYLDMLAGTGNADTATTDSLTINYTGYLKDGTQFDTGKNFTFQLVTVVVGMRQGLYGMKEGGKRKLVIPSALAYGSQAVRDTSGAVKIPRQSTLVFDIELIKAYNHPDTTTALRSP